MATNPFSWLMGLFSLDIGIDLGTANTLVHVRGKGVVINEPSWVVINKRTRETIAVGNAAKEMVGRTPINYVAIRPLRDGVISEFDITKSMLEYFIGKVHQQAVVPMPRPRVAICIPSGATEVEKRAVYDAAMAAGARETYLVEEPRAAALGAGLSVNEVKGTMIVDIGGGTTEVAVISMGETVISRSLRIAGDEIDEDILQYIRKKYNLLIGERMAEQIKIAIGSAYPLQTELTYTARGRNLITGLPGSVDVSSVEVREAINPSLQIIIDTVKDALDEVPPELVSDLLDSGVCLSGGGAQILGLVPRLKDDLNLRVWVADDPLTCVARGAGLVLENLSSNRRFLVGIDRGSTKG